MRHALQPFQKQPELAAFQFMAAASRSGGLLVLHYQLSGPLEQLLIPALSSQPERRDELWHSTCFEAFLAVPGRSSYWEVNLSPSGDWNLYALSDYRQGLHPEPSIAQLPFQLKQQQLAQGTSVIDLTVELDLAPRPGLALIQADEPLELSATAVIEHRKLGCSFWAWQHKGPEADFHRRDSFLPLI